jgi:hypothetical protein
MVMFIAQQAIVHRQTSTRKVYFDAAGADPVAVTYMGNSGQALMWCGDAMMTTPMMSSFAVVWSVVGVIVDSLG